MRAPPDDIDISTVEELDPEPLREGLSRTREFLLGLLIVTAVLGRLGVVAAGARGRITAWGSSREPAHWDAARPIMPTQQLQRRRRPRCGAASLSRARPAVRAAESIHGRQVGVAWQAIQTVRTSTQL